MSSLAPFEQAAKVGDFMLVLRDALIKLGIYQPDKGLVEQPDPSPASWTHLDICVRGSCCLGARKATVGAFLARHFGPHWDKYQSPYGWAIEFQQEDMLGSEAVVLQARRHAFRA